MVQKKVVAKNKKAAPKKVAKKAVKPTVKKVTKTATIENIYSKAKMIQHIAEATELTKKDVAKCLDSLADVIALHLKKRGPGRFILPGIAKFRVVRKAAIKAREGVNPFTGVPTVFAAKPARNVVKVKPLKKVKDMVN